MTRRLAQSGVQEALLVIRNRGMLGDCYCFCWKAVSKIPNEA